MTRVFNFSAGPAALPESVLRQAADEMLDWKGSGMSVMEMSHRGKEYMAIHAQAEADLRELLAIPANYKVLFLQGGAIGQNAIVPMNMLRGKTSADYINTGEWAKKSIKEAKNYCKVNVAATAEDTGFTSVPPQSTWKLDPNAAYVHICSNETIGGVEYHWVPDLSATGVPLIADMSSNILSRQIDVSQYGLIYAGAQKNVGIAGTTLMLVRDDLLKPARKLPLMLQYGVQAKDQSRHNTPPVFAIYLSGLVFKWILKQGGLDAVHKANMAKAKIIYDVLESVPFFKGHARPDSRSLMNITFRCPTEQLDELFVKEAFKNGMDQLKGHRSTGGMRASTYNAFPTDGCKALADFMREFAKKHG